MDSFSFGLNAQIIASCEGVGGVVISWEPNGWLVLSPQGWSMFADLVEWANEEMECWYTWIEEGYEPDDFYNLAYEEALTGARTWLPLADSGIVADISQEERGHTPEWKSEFRGEVSHLLDSSQISFLVEALASKVRISFSMPEDYWSDFVDTVEYVNNRLTEIHEIIERWSGDPVGVTLREELEEVDEELADILPLLQREDLRTAHSCARHFGLVHAPSDDTSMAVVPTESYLDFRASPAGVGHINRLIEELRQALPGCWVRTSQDRLDDRDAIRVGVHVSYLPQFHPDEFIGTDDPEQIKEQQQVFLMTLARWAGALPDAKRRLF